VLNRIIQRIVKLLTRTGYALSGKRPSEKTCVRPDDSHSPVFIAAPTLPYGSSIAHTPPRRPRFDCNMHGVARPDLRTGAWTLRDHGSDRLVAVEIDDIVL
jgi:hypothetical protein